MRMNSRVVLSRRRVVASTVATLAAFGTRNVWAVSSAGRWSVRDFGAKGDGETLDTAAIQAAINAAAQAGGGFVDLPAGRYLCYTIHLRSHVTLCFSPGTVVIGAQPVFADAAKQYDPPEPQSDSIRPYQDFGHNHWHNSLFLGEDLESFGMTGLGELWGRGLEKGDGPAEEHSGAGNKLIALKRCRNVLLRDLSLRAGGHFGVLATAVDNLTIENLKIDTGRDGIDIDSCRHVHILGCIVNSPWDDAIVLKSSYSLGELRSTEQVTISDCVVTGSYQVGSMLDGKDLAFAAEGDQPARVGRIKIGTETNGDIRNVVVSNCILDGCHGLAVISEDGGNVEDVSFSNITMRNMIGPPIFVRLGGRMREPLPHKVSTIRRIGFDQIDCISATSDNCSIIAGIPGHPVQEVWVRGLHVRHPGGGLPRKDAILEELATYPEPKMFGATPAHGFYIRHAEEIEMRDVLVQPEVPEQRPLVWMDDVQQARFDDVRCQGAAEGTIASRIDGVKTQQIWIGTPQ
jgi:polygalacturonase